MSAWTRSVTGRAYHFKQLWRGPDRRGACPERSLRTATVVVHAIASANLAPSAKVEEVRHRRGHRLESGCRSDLSWVRFPLLPPFSVPHRFAMLPKKSL